MDDWQLLNDYATRNSEEAFRQLADRYAGMVYHAALRQTGNTHTAEEITQAVFIALARKARNIPRQAVLYGWLFRATRYAVLNRLRDDACRRRYEQQALDMQNPTQTNEPDPVWEQIAALLDAALDLLPKSDREIVMIRYFGDKSHKEVAEILGVSEETAKKRVSRALERLRVIFARRGITVPATALSAALLANTSHAAPAGLVSVLAATAVAKAPAAAASAALAKTVVNIMAWAKLKTAAFIALGVVFAAGTTTVTVRQIHRHSVAFWQTPDFRWEILVQAPPQVTILPSKYPQVGSNWLTGRDSDTNGEDHARLLGIGVDLDAMLHLAHHAKDMVHFSQVSLPEERYDFIANLPNGSRAALAEMIRQKFGYVAKKEGRTLENALALTLGHADAPGRTPATGTNGAIAGMRDGKRFLENFSAADLASFMEFALGIPVSDQTGLTNRYDFEFSLLAQPGDDPASRTAWAKTVLEKELGLKLISDASKHEALVIEKAD